MEISVGFGVACIRFDAQIIIGFRFNLFLLFLTLILIWLPLPISNLKGIVRKLRHALKGWGTKICEVVEKVLFYVT